MQEVAFVLLVVQTTLEPVLVTWLSHASPAAIQTGNCVEYSRVTQQPVVQVEPEQQIEPALPQTVQIRSAQAVSASVQVDLAQQRVPTAPQILQVPVAYRSQAAFASLQPSGEALVDGQQVSPRPPQVWQVLDTHPVPASVHVELVQQGSPFLPQGWQVALLLRLLVEVQARS